MSIMIQQIVDGKVKRQCDAKCYNAKTKTCHCICGGHLHGLGRNVTVRKLRTMKKYFRDRLEYLPDIKIKFF